jgi:hypothetical protein
MAMAVRPQWIAKMYPGKTGRDHLGLGSVSSDQILPSLAPGINVLTIHPRYHSFYTFLLDEFWRRDLPRTHASFVAFYRPREFIYSLAAHLCDRPEHSVTGSIVGADKTAGLARSKLTAYDTTTDYIKSALGGYGLYYRSVMVELGFVYPGDPTLLHKFDVPTDLRGHALAESFRAAVRDTEYYRAYFDHDVTLVPREVVVEYARRACLCQLQTADAPDRRLLLDAFLHSGFSEADAARRRQTFRLFLDVAGKMQARTITQDQFRQLLYFGATRDGRAYRPDAQLVDIAARWRVYQAREYYAYALNALWCGLCDWGLARHGDARPLPLGDFYRDVDTMLSMAVIADSFGIQRSGLTAASSFVALLNWLCEVLHTEEWSFDARCGADAAINEHLLYDLIQRGRSNPGVILAAPFVLLALVYLRFAPFLDIPYGPWEVARMGGSDRLSLHRFLTILRAKLRQGQPTIGEIARWLIADYVVLQHDLVAASKLPENTYRFRREGGLLRFFAFENPLRFMDSRFEAIGTTLHELGLCGSFARPGHGLRDLGERLLGEGDLALSEVAP